MTEIFLDAAYAIALSSPKDKFHNRAIQLAEQLEKSNIQIVTTRAVLLEIGNALSRQRYRAASVQLLVALEADPTVEIVPLTDQLYVRALKLYRDRPDKEWGMVDCISFIVMEDRGIPNALTTDNHFQQAGFHVLLREDEPLEQ